MRDLVLRYMGEQEAIKRSVLTLDSVTRDVDGLKKLIVRYDHYTDNRPFHVVGIHFLSHLFQCIQFISCT